MGRDGDRQLVLLALFKRPCHLILTDTVSLATAAARGTQKFALLDKE